MATSASVMKVSKHPAWDEAQNFLADFAADDNATSDAPPAPAPNAAPAAAPKAVAAPAPNPSVAAPAAAPVPDPEVAQLRRQLEQSDRALAEERAARVEREQQSAIALEQVKRELSTETQGRIEQLTAQLADRDQRLSKAEVKKLLDVSALADSENIEMAAAQELVDKVIGPALEALHSRVQKADDVVSTEMATLRKELEKQSTKAERDRTDADARQVRTLTNRAILEKHPDFQDLTNDAKFQAKLQEVIPGTRRTRGEELRAAYNEGDAQFVIDMVNQIKGASPDPMDIADVPSGGGGTVAREGASRQDETTYSYDDLAEMNYKLRRGEITRQEHAAMRADFEKAEKDGRVK